MINHIQFYPNSNDDVINKLVKKNNLDNQQLLIGWNGETFTAKIIDTNNKDHDYLIVRNLSDTNYVKGLGFDTNGLYALVDSTKIYITTK